MCPERPKLTKNAERCQFTNILALDRIQCDGKISDIEIIPYKPGTHNHNPIFEYQVVRWLTSDARGKLGC